MMIDEKIDIDYVFSLLNIEDLINHYHLKGRLTHDDFIGCCPLHKDKKPSFSLNVKTGLWVCWACGEKGNIFQLIQSIEDISFKEALHWLLKFLGITDYTPSLDYCNQLLKKLNKVFDDEEDEELKTISLPLECKSALDYPIALRRVTKKEIKTFNIQYCKKGFYRGHLIIPIVFENSLVAFFARDMLDQSEKIKKYNSGAKIGKIFFNWDEAVKYPKYVIVVEGIIDCIKICSWGYNCIALLGIHLSVKKRSLLLKNFESIFIALDNDYKEKYNPKGELIISNPGQAAAVKLISHLKEEVKIYNVVLPTGKDPDECLQQEFENSLRKSKRFK